MNGSSDMDEVLRQSILDMLSHNITIHLYSQKFGDGQEVSVELKIDGKTVSEDRILLS